MYVTYFKQKITSEIETMSETQKKYYTKCKANLQSGIEYYKNLMQHPSMEADLDELAIQTAAL